MTIAHIYGLDAAGDWAPMLTSGLGASAGSGGGAGASASATAPWSYAALTGGITNTADVTLAAAGGVGNSNYLSAIQVMNTSATATEVVIKDGTTVIWRMSVGASMTAPVSIPLSLAGSENTALKAACITNATATYINAQGYVDASPAERLAAVQTGALKNEIFDDNGAAILDDNSAKIYIN